MDNELIERARELARAATPGPWSEGDDDNGDWFIKVPDPGHNIFIGNLEDTCGICHANSAFIAASRELVPALCDALEAANNIIATLCAEFNCYPAELHAVIMREYQVGTDNADALEAAQAENARLREALHHIGYQSASMSSVDFDWHNEWRNLRNEARAALEPRP